MSNRGPDLLPALRDAVTSLVRAEGPDLTLVDSQFCLSCVRPLRRTRCAEVNQSIESTGDRRLVDHEKRGDVALITTIIALFLALVPALVATPAQVADSTSHTAQGTRVVMRTRLYGKLARTEALGLEGEIDLIGQTYQDVAVAGTCSPAQRALFLDVGRRLVAAGAEAIVLAGRPQPGVRQAEKSADNRQAAPDYPMSKPSSMHGMKKALAAS